MPGGLLNLVSYGSQNVILTGNPTTTFFKCTYKKYTNFGRVISNMEAVDAINRGEPPANPTLVLQASLASENKAKPAAAPAIMSDAPVTADDLNAPIEN